MAEGWLQVMQEVLKVPGLLAEVYGDLAKPGVQQVGKALGTVLGLGNTILWPLHLANERSRVYLERNLQDYRARLEGVPQEKVISVAPEIGVPIAEKLSYVSDQRLADLYVTLLTKASSADSVWEAHPSFVNVINNLSPDEAHFLEYFVSKTNLEFVEARWMGQKSYAVAGELLLHPERTARLLYPQNAPSYISNLAGLGLVEIHHGRSLHSRTVDYESIEESWANQFLQTLAPTPKRELKFVRGGISITTFGKQFMHACHRN